MRLRHGSSNGIWQSGDLRPRTNRIENDLIGYGFELTWYAIESLAHKKWPLAPPAKGYGIMVAVILCIDFVNWTHRVAPILSETPSDNLCLNKNVTGRAKHIK
jgi:hypothetical protein